MATKHETIIKAARGEGCLGRAQPDEPVFVLRAKDPLAAVVVGIWCQLARRMAHHEPEKVSEALQIAEAMGAWREAHCQPYHWGDD